jgi:hypothetical protein
MKRVFLIRESDFKKWEKADLKTKEWDTMEFKPVTREWLQKQASWFTIKGTKHIATQFRHWQYPGEWIKRTNIRKYQNNYEQWLYRYDDAGVMRVRASLGQPESVMGLAIVEKLEVQLDDSQLPEPMLNDSDEVMSAE